MLLTIRCLILSGKPHKVVKYATNITESKLRNAEFEGKIAALNRIQAVIEFELDGTIIKANDNFLATVGYTLDEIKVNTIASSVTLNTRLHKNILIFGKNSVRVSQTRVNISVLTKMVMKYGSMPHITRIGCKW